MDANSKLKNIVHFICRDRAMEPDSLGLTKLHKIIYYSDLQRLKSKAQTISDAVFIKKPYGPCVANLDAILSELVSEGRLSVIPQKEEFETTWLIGKGHPDMSAFDEREVSILKSQIDNICGNPASYISEKSHGPIWKMTEMGERMSLLSEIAYQMIRVTEADIEYAANLPD
jgi:hypothetical protein